MKNSQSYWVEIIVMSAQNSVMADLFVSVSDASLSAGLIASIVVSGIIVTLLVVVCFCWRKSLNTLKRESEYKNLQCEKLIPSV